MFFSELEICRQIYKNLFLLCASYTLYNVLVYPRTKTISSFGFPLILRSTHIHTRIYASMYKTIDNFSKPLYQSPTNKLA